MKTFPGTIPLLLLYGFEGYLCRTDVKYGHTRKKELVDRLCHLSLVSPITVFFVSQYIWETDCKQFHNDCVVCPPRLRGSVFTTSTVNDIDYNPRSTTSKESFMALASLFQHFVFDSAGLERNVTTDAKLHSSKSVDNYHTSTLLTTSRNHCLYSKDSIPE